MKRLEEIYKEKEKIRREINRGVDDRRLYFMLGVLARDAEDTHTKIFMDMKNNERQRQ